MEEHEASGSWSDKGGDVGGGELVDAFKIPANNSQSHLQERLSEELSRSWGDPYIHLVVGPLHLIHEIQAAVYDEGIHVASFLTETGDAISTLLRRAEFELKEWLVSRADYAEEVGHVVRFTKETGTSGSNLPGLYLLPWP